MISNKNVVIEPTARVNEAKICSKTAKNCKYSHFPTQIFKYYTVFQHIFVFLRESVSGCHDIKQENGVNKAKIYRKIVKKCVFPYLQ